MMNNEKEKDAIDASKLDDILPKYEPLKLNGINLAQNYVSAFNTGMNIYQCVNQLQGYIEWVVKAVNDVVKLWNVQVGESIDQSKAIARETTKEQFNVEWENKQPELIEQVNTLTTNQFNEDWGVLENRINTTLETQNTNIENVKNEQTTLSNRVDSFSNPNLFINPDFKINQRGQSTYNSNTDIYTVDRWSVSNVNAIVNSDGTITVSPLNGLGYINYRQEGILYGKHTCSIYVQAITGEVKVYYRNKNGLDIKLGTLKQGLNTFTQPNDDGFKRLIIVISGDATVTVTFKYMKLEQGSVATPFVAPNYTDELLRCQRYYISRQLNLYGACNADATLSEDLQYLPQMRIEPTFTKNIVHSKNIDESSIAFYGTNAKGHYLYFKSTTSSSSSPYILGITVNADAEIY